MKRAGFANNNTIFKMFLFPVSAAALTVVLFWRCRYGYAGNDEAFYLTIPYRLLQGDCLFISEWNLSQLSGVLLVPLMKLFLCLRGNTESIVLAFRYLFVFFQIFAGIVVFICLRKKSFWGAYAGAIILMAYAPFGIPALSYNSMGILFLLLSGILMYGSERLYISFLSGLCYAAAVLCCPTLAVLSIFFVIRPLFKKRLCHQLADSGKVLAGFFGVVAAASIFVVFLLSRAKLSDIIASIPYILSDPAHNDGIVAKLMQFKYALVYYDDLIPVYYAYCAMLIAGAFSKKDTSRIIIVILSLVSALICVIYYLVNHCLINCFIFPVNLTALVCFVTVRNIDLNDIFQCIWIPGMLYSLLIHFASNQQFYAVSSASIVALPASAIIIVNTVRTCFAGCKSKAFGMVLISLTVMLFAVQFSSVLYTRINSIFWDSPIEFQTEYVDGGPLKGLFVSQKRWQEYYDFMEAVSEIDDVDSILFLTRTTCGYLFRDWRMASFSAWLSRVNPASVQKLCAYYDMDCHELPQAIFAEKDDLSYLDFFAKRYGYSDLRQTSTGAYVLYKRLDE